MLIIEKLQKQDSFTVLERTIAAYFQANATSLNQQSAHYIAVKLYTVPSTITRFCQKLGFSGYPAFRQAFWQEYTYLQANYQNIDPNRPFASVDTDYQLAGKMNSLYQETIQDTYALIDHETLERCISLLKHVQNIHLVSLGAYTQLAAAFQEKMIKIGKNVMLHERIDMAYYHASSSARSCFILISYAGENQEILRLAKLIKQEQQELIIMTSYGPNSLSALSKNTLFLSTREHLRNDLGTFGPYISLLYLLDVLYCGIFKKNYEYNLQFKITKEESYQRFRHTNNPLIKD